MATVRIRNIVNRQTREMPGTTEMLRGPYDLGSAVEPVEYRGDGLVTYVDKSGEHVSRVKPGRLGDCAVGEWVFVHYDALPEENGNAWWPCEIVAVNGDKANQ